MDTNKDFSIVCRRFHQDLPFIAHSQASTLEGFIDMAIEGLDQQVRSNAKKFLSEQLSQRNPQELQDLWQSAPSDIVISNDQQFLSFLKLLEARL